MKNSIKRAQSQACLGFAERKNFRPLAKLKKLTMTLVALFALSTGAQADWTGGTYTATTNETLVATAVSADATLTINEGITVTVNNGLTIAEGATLTVTGGGTLEVNGKNGANGQNVWFDDEKGDFRQSTPGGDGTVAISGIGNLYVKNAIIIANGGNGGQGGNNDENEGYDASRGGNGANAITGVSVIFKEGMLTAIGGSGGLGGSWEAGSNATSGSDATGFASFPAIDDARLSYSDNGTDYTKYPSGDTSLHKYMKVEPNTIEVIINDAKSEASFEMLKYDVTATYTLKRDMSVDMVATVQDANANSRFRVEQSGENFQPVGMTPMDFLAMFKIHDDIENMDLTAGTDYLMKLYHVDENGQPVGKAIAPSEITFAPGKYVFKAVAKDGSNYSGETALSNVFTLFKGYQLEIAAGEYATFYMNEVLKVDESTADGQLYTITNVDMEGGTATASEVSVADSETPLLVKNNAAETKTILLVPTTDTADEVTVAEQFKGTLVALPVTAADMDVYDYYVCNGRAFVWVKDAGTIPANRAWLQLPTGNAEARTLRIIFSDEATGVDAIRNINTGDWYDLNGRKLPAAPTRKGVYILNGKKAVVK